jgi:XRE family aerobic/anaerobic benzoate catabolism transcriptional regulator
MRYTPCPPRMNAAPELPHRPDRRAKESERLQMLAARVRQLRALRGMPRQLCAEQAGVSLPHLARLEAGTYNVSILVLDRIARALDLPLDSLLARPQDSRREWLAQLVNALPDSELEAFASRILEPRDSIEARSRRIALLGIRGSGKSTVGAILAERLQLPFVELTREIEQSAGLAAPAMFERRGQAAYRALEEQALTTILERSQFVLTTGGGVVAQPRAYTMLMRHCLTVWLRATPEVYFARTYAQKDERISTAAVRAHALDNIRLTMQVREPLYRKASIVVDTSALSPVQVADEVMRALRDRN